MSIETAVLFEPDGKPTYTFLAQAREKGPLRPLQAAIRAVDEQGGPTTYFRAWWSSNLPARNVLPDVMANPDGTGSAEFWVVFR